MVIFLGIFRMRKQNSWCHVSWLCFFVFSRFCVQKNLLPKSSLPWVPLSPCTDRSVTAPWVSATCKSHSLPLMDLKVWGFFCLFVFVVANDHSSTSGVCVGLLCLILSPFVVSRRQTPAFILEFSRVRHFLALCHNPVKEGGHPHRCCEEIENEAKWVIWNQNLAELNKVLRPLTLNKTTYRIVLCDQKCRNFIISGGPEVNGRLIQDVPSRARQWGYLCSISKWT